MGQLEGLLWQFEGLVWKFEGLLGLFETLFSSHDCSCPLAPRKSFDILAIYKSDYYYYYYFTDCVCGLVVTCTDS